MSTTRAPRKALGATRRTFLGAGVIATATLLLGTDSSLPRILVTSNSPEPRIFYQARVSNGDKVTMRWIHSVDHNPWTEHYIVTDRQLMLDCIELRTMGAGTPSEAPKVYTSDGKLHLCGYERPFASLDWVHSHDVNHTLTIQRQSSSGWQTDIIKTTDIPHHTSTTLRVG